ncbi:MAG: envelope stress response membrane protein PspC [Desulfobacteraceae bacterium]|nr:envelope stress response membrane protein PspC [Desulfobacteraceae bacterium]
MRKFFSDKHQGIYRSRNGVILGVCRGLSDHFNLDVFWFRIILVIVFIISGVWPILILYFVASLFMKPEPVHPIQTDDEQAFYDTYTSSRHQATRHLRHRFEDLERRIRRMEDSVTDREFDWDRKLNNGL